MAMADQILVLVDGVAVQLTRLKRFGKPRAPIHRRNHRRSADTEGQVVGDHIVTAFGNLPRANLSRAAV